MAYHARDGRTYSHKETTAQYRARQARRHANSEVEKKKTRLYTYSAIAFAVIALL